MANLSSIARPYARAAFEYAHDKHALPEWKACLSSAAFAIALPSVSALLDHPECSSMKLYQMLEDVLSSQLNTDIKNFLLLLAQNKRLNLLPEISSLFNDYEAQLQKITNVRVITAAETDEHFKQALTAALTKRIQREVILHCETDASLLGGAIIHIADGVIDGSIRGKLNRLHEFSLR
jgi:F-type H+-transporting ATPase subunit delta